MNPVRGAACTHGLPNGDHVTTHDTPSADREVTSIASFSKREKTDSSTLALNIQVQTWSQDRGDSEVHRPVSQQGARHRRPWGPVLRTSPFRPGQTTNGFHLNKHHIMSRDVCPRYLYSITSSNLSSSTMFWLLDKQPVIEAKSNLLYAESGFVYQQSVHNPITKRNDCRVPE